MKMTVMQQQWEIIRYAMKKRGGKFTEKKAQLYEDIYFEEKGETYCWRWDKLVNEIILFATEGSI